MNSETVDGKTYKNYFEAARAKGLTTDKNVWNETLNDAVTMKIPKNIRDLFAYIYLFTYVTDISKFMTNHKDNLIEDYCHFHRHPVEEFFELCVSYALNNISRILNTHGKRCRDFGLEDPLTSLLPLCATFDEEENFNYEETLNEEQRIAFEQIMTTLNNSNNEKSFFLDGLGGSGKTYLYKALYYTIKRRIAAKLLHKGRTYHSRFKVPLILNETSVCAFALQSIDRLLRDIQYKSRVSFGGKVIIKGGDYRQCLLVIPGAQASDVVQSSLKNCSLWNDFKILKLRNNMQAKDKPYKETLIEILSHMISKDIFGEVQFVNTIYKFSKKVILTHTNEEVDKINQSEKTYLSTDSLISDDTDDVTNYSIEFLNSLTPFGTPLHALYLQKGAIIMLLRNLNTESGFFNGTRLIVYYIFLQRIDLTSDAGLPFQLKRRQFPIRLAFAMIINKAQGQTLYKVGIFLPTPDFGHRQLYVAFSRVRSLNDVKVYIKDTAEQGKILPGSDKIFTKNVVYKAVFEN
ncbi:PIF1-like helicase [Hamiltosporidium tvaerminnensis]|uniref:ATP-dependent DNA helicase n=1 Tax=Hamiltosporidium tvaerminnensis TaxID=1176355 RepID=A0A4Q9LXL2_9MICR|nr:PIF1-like helicase [Hamiltosporidium tvaerminnensis]